MDVCEDHRYPPRESLVFTDSSGRQGGQGRAQHHGGRVSGTLTASAWNIAVFLWHCHLWLGDIKRNTALQGGPREFRAAMQGEQGSSKRPSCLRARSPCLTTYPGTGAHTGTRQAIFFHGSATPYPGSKNHARTSQPSTLYRSTATCLQSACECGVRACFSSPVGGLQQQIARGTRGVQVYQ